MKRVYGLAKAIAVGGLFAALTIVVVGWAFVLENEALVVNGAPPSSEDVRVTRAFVHEVRAATAEPVDGDRIIVLQVKDLGSMLRVGGRFVKGFRSKADIENGEVAIAVSFPIPWFRGQKWLNGKTRIPPFAGHVTLTELRIGKLSLPPDLSLQVARVFANLVLGSGRGDRILNSASRMQLTDNSIQFAMQLDEDGRGSVMRGVFGMLRGNNMPSADEINRYYAKIRIAMDTGDLPLQGSFVPYIRFVLRAVLDDKADTSVANKYTAAVFALTKACGAKDFRLIVGRMTAVEPDKPGTWKSDCQKITLANRIDSKRHFITAAAIRAASNRGVAIPIGEFKELHDSISGAGGFDFTDIAANNSGIRLSDLMMSHDIEDWPDILSRMKSESDLIISFDGIPGRMPEQEFKAKYGDVDSARYMDMLNFIERRIDQLAVHAPQ